MEWDVATLWQLRGLCGNYGVNVVLAGRLLVCYADPIRATYKYRKCTSIRHLRALRKSPWSLLSGWMNYNNTACCWFPKSSNILILPSQFWQIKFESCWLHSSKCRILVLLRYIPQLSRTSRNCHIDPITATREPHLIHFAGVNAALHLFFEYKGWTN